MHNPDFRYNKKMLRMLESGNFTSLIIRLQLEKNPGILEGIRNALDHIEATFKNFYPSAEFVDNYQAAHITVRSISDFCIQKCDDLRRYVEILRPIVYHWLQKMPETKIYLMGLFSHLHSNKGLSIGIRVYPTLPLLQLIRGQAAETLYNHAAELKLRPETQFHTMLTHATLMRCRKLIFPVSREAVHAFREIMQQYDQYIFGELSGLRADDFFVRNGKSDRLLLRNHRNRRVGCEISLADTETSTTE